MKFNLKYNEIIHSTKWKNLENIMPSEISQMQKDACYMISHV